MAQTAAQREARRREQQAAAARATAQAQGAAAQAEAAAQEAAQATNLPPTTEPVTGTTKVPGEGEAVIIGPKRPNWVVRSWNAVMNRLARFGRWIGGGFKRGAKATGHGIKTGYNATSRVLVRAWDRGWTRSWMFVTSVFDMTAFGIVYIIKLPVEMFHRIRSSNSKVIADAHVERIHMNRQARREMTRTRSSRIRAGLDPETGMPLGATATAGERVGGPRNWARHS